jgi:hypothetical protein
LAVTATPVPYDRGPVWIERIWKNFGVYFSFGKEVNQSVWNKEKPNTLSEERE